MVDGIELLFIHDDLKSFDIIKSNILDIGGLSEGNIFLKGSNIAIIITINGSDLPRFPYKY